MMNNFLRIRYAKSLLLSESTKRPIRIELYQSRIVFTLNLTKRYISQIDDTMMNVCIGIGMTKRVSSNC